jgi:hypothetical protein
MSWWLRDLMLRLCWFRWVRICPIWDGSTSRNCRFHDLGAEDGGAAATVGDPDQVLMSVWVGVVDGGLTGSVTARMR